MATIRTALTELKNILEDQYRYNVSMKILHGNTTLFIYWSDPESARRFVEGDLAKHLPNGFRSDTYRIAGWYCVVVHWDHKYNANPETGIKIK